MHTLDVVWPILFIIDPRQLSYNHMVATRESGMGHLLLLDKAWRPLEFTWHIDFNAILNHACSVVCLMSMIGMWSIRSPFSMWSRPMANLIDHKNHIRMCRSHVISSSILWHGWSHFWWAYENWGGIANLYVSRISFDVQLQIQGVTWRFGKKKKKRKLWIDIYILFQSVTSILSCLVVCIISNFNVSIDAWFVFFTSHSSCQILNCACQLLCNFSFSILLWKLLCV